MLHPKIPTLIEISLRKGCRFRDSPFSVRGDGETLGRNAKKYPYRKNRLFGSSGAPTPTKNLKRLPRRYVFIFATPLLRFFPLSVNAPFAFSCGRRGTAPRWMRSAPPFSPTSRQRTLRLLLLEKGDRSAVDEECAPSPTDLSSSYRLSLSFAFSCRRRGTAPRWMRSNVLSYSKTSTE